MTYLDASVLTPLFVAEARSVEARDRIVGLSLVVSDLALAEVSSAIARRVRMGDIAASDATAKLTKLDSWAAGAIMIENLNPTDFVSATAFVRRFELGLRTPDALHLAITQRLGATLFTFDAKMAAAAATLGVAVAT